MRALMTESESVRELVRQAQSGERRAFEVLTGRYKGRLLRRVEFRLGTHLRGTIEAEDIVQETFLKALRSIGGFSFRGEESFFRWLAGIAENLLLDLAEQQKRKRHLRLDGDVRGSRVSPGSALQREERFERLEAALKELSPDHREVILLARVEGLPLKEVAARMGRSPNAVGQLLWRALQKLRERFGDTESFHLPPRRLGEGGLDDVRRDEPSGERS